MSRSKRMGLSRPLRVMSILWCLAMIGCRPDLGECDMPTARLVVYSALDGSPSYAGQALLQGSCGDGSFCHAERASDRFGAPADLDFDLGLARDDAGLERLRRGQRHVYENRYGIMAAIEDGSMPPGDAGERVASLGTPYLDLPPLSSSSGRSIVRNWLACGVPVVERTQADRAPGLMAVGATVAPMPMSGMPLECLTTERLCAGRCIDVTNSAANCGDCGMSCELGRACLNGTCDVGCGAGLTECLGRCVDTQSSFSDCGDCDRVCNAGEVCAAGVCSSEGCPDGTAACSGSCVDLLSSLMHCGGCNTTCSAGQTCEAGACSCGDVQSDPLNCGACGRVCPGGTSCVAGMCQCGGGFSLCGGRCVDLQTDGANCGGCGVSCGAGRLCDAGVCATCGAGVSFANDIQPIFNANCAGSLCHAGNRPAGGLSLDPGRAYSNLVGVASDCGNVRVAPGLPEASYLINKLTGVGMCKGNRMPLRLPALSNATIDVMRAWICGGAPNN